MVVVQCNNSQGRLNDLAGGILVHSGFVPDSLTKRCRCVCVCVCEHASVSVPCLHVCVRNVKRAGLETDETNRCQICRVGPLSSRRSAECSPISHLAVLIRGHAAGSLMCTARPKEC